MSDLVVREYSDVPQPEDSGGCQHRQKQPRLRRVAGVRDDESDAPPGEPLTGVHRRFLADHTQVYLVVRRPDGKPMGYPMVGRWENGGLEFSTYRKSAKVRHVEHDDRVCCLVVPRDRADDDRLLTVWGRAGMTDANRDRWRTALRGREGGSAGINVPPEVRASVADRMASQKRGILRVDVERAAFMPGSCHG
jgi:pyridoxamine 5'-phosphate oxidase-like protein